MSHYYKSPYADNAAPIEKALGDAHRQLLYQQLTPYPLLLRPLQTPAQFLTVSALERGVIDWYEGDSDPVKRATIDGSFRFLKKSGTREALQEALAALNITADFVKSSRPYVLQIDGFLQDQPIDLETIARAETRIASYKNESDDIELTLTRVDSTDVFIGARVQVCDVITYEAA